MNNPLNTFLLNQLRLNTNNKFNFTCTIQRGSSAGTDDYGQPIPSIYSDLATDVPCNYYENAGANSGRQRPGDADYILLQPYLHVSFDTNIQIADRIKNISSIDNATVGTTYFQVLDVVQRVTYKLVILKEIG